MVSKKMSRRTRSETGLSRSACSEGVWVFHFCRGTRVCDGVFATWLRINRRPLTVVDLACASQILILIEISFFSQLSSFPLFICAASRDLDIGLTRLEKSHPCPCIPPDLVRDKSSAVEARADRMSPIDTNAEDSTNKFDLLRFVLRSFS